MKTIFKYIAIAILGLTFFSCEKGEPISRERGLDLRKEVTEVASDLQGFELNSSLGAVAIEPLSSNTDEVSEGKLRASLHFSGLANSAKTTLSAANFGSGKREARWGVIYNDGNLYYAMNCDNATSIAPTNPDLLTKNTIFFKDTETDNTIGGASLRMYCRPTKALDYITKGVMLLEGKAGTGSDNTKQFFMGETSPNHRLEGLQSGAFQANRHIPIMTKVVDFEEITKPTATNTVKFAPRGSLIGLNLKNKTYSDIIVTAVLVEKAGALNYSGYFDWSIAVDGKVPFTPKYTTAESGQAKLSFLVYADADATEVGYAIAQNNTATPCFYLWGFQNEGKLGEPLRVQIRYKDSGSSDEKVTQVFTVPAPNSQIVADSKQFDDGYAYNTILTISQTNGTGGESASYADVDVQSGDKTIYSLGLSNETIIIDPLRPYEIFVGIHDFDVASTQEQLDAITLSLEDSPWDMTLLNDNPLGGHDKTFKIVVPKNTTDQPRRVKCTTTISDHNPFRVFYLQDKDLVRVESDIDGLYYEDIPRYTNIRANVSKAYEFDITVRGVDINQTFLKVYEDNKFYESTSIEGTLVKPHNIKFKLTIPANTTGEFKKYHVAVKDHGMGRNKADLRFFTIEQVTGPFVRVESNVDGLYAGDITSGRTIELKGQIAYEVYVTLEDPDAESLELVENYNTLPWILEPLSSPEVNQKKYKMTIPKNNSQGDREVALIVRRGSKEFRWFKIKQKLAGPLVRVESNVDGLYAEDIQEGRIVELKGEKTYEVYVTLEDLNVESLELVKDQSLLPWTLESLPNPGVNKKKYKITIPENETQDVRELKLRVRQGSEELRWFKIKQKVAELGSFVKVEGAGETIEDIPDQQTLSLKGENAYNIVFTVEDANVSNLAVSLTPISGWELAEVANNIPNQRKFILFVPHNINKPSSKSAVLKFGSLRTINIYQPISNIEGYIPRIISLDYETPLDYMAEYPAVNKARNGFVKHLSSSSSNVAGSPGDLPDTDVGYYDESNVGYLFPYTTTWLTSKHYQASEGMFRSIVPSGDVDGNPVILFHQPISMTTITEAAQIGEIPTTQEYTSDYINVYEGSSYVTYAIRFKGTDWVSAWRYSIEDYEPDTYNCRFVIQCMPLKFRPDVDLNKISTAGFFRTNACSTRILPSYGVDYWGNLALKHSGYFLIGSSSAFVFSENSGAKITTNASGAFAVLPFRRP